jgi:hypothetical protein
LDQGVDWAEEEFGAAELGDARLTARLVEMARLVGAQPSASLPQACAGEPGALKAAYRFFDNDGVEAAEILASHVKATYARLAGERWVLAVQDTTYLDFGGRPGTTGLGPLRSVAQQGMLAHTTLALTPERLPLGLLGQQVLVRDEATYAAPTDHKERPITEKESVKWLRSVAAVTTAATACPGTHFVSVGDREADVYDLFVLDRPANVDLLVRAAQDRRVDGPERFLHATVEAARVAATTTVSVPPRDGQPGRAASLSVRHCPVVLRPPRHRAAERLPTRAVWAVLAREEDPPAGQEPLAWLLLTTRPVSSAEDALERVDWYAGRWGIELLHKVLKSGCRIEIKQLHTADRLIRCLAMYSVVAWRVLYAVMLARAVPDAPCLALLDANEWRALYCITHHTTVLPAAPPRLGDAVRWIALLGGFVKRHRTSQPGVTVLWRGFQRLYDHTAMYKLMRPDSNRRTCG